MANDNPVLDVFKSLPLTFYSKVFYRKAVREWSGIGAGFILIVTAFSLILSGVAMYTHMEKQDAMKMEELFAQLPDATIKDHKLSIDAPSPFIVKFPSGPNVNQFDNLVIDTDFASTDTAAIQDYMSKHNAFFLVTATKLIADNGSGIQINNLPSFPDRRFTHEDYQNYGRIIDTWFHPLVIASMVIMLTVANFIVAATGGGITMLLGLVAGVKLEYAAALRLAACAAVPATAVVAPLQLSFGIKILIWFGYAIFGLLALRRAEVTNTGV